MDMVSAASEAVQSPSTRESVTGPTGLVAIALVLVFSAAALGTPFLAPADPSEIVGTSFEPPTFTWGDGAAYLGTDQLGRDVLTRLLYSARNSLGVAVAGVGLAMLFGYVASLLIGSEPRKHSSNFFGAVGWDLLQLTLAFPPLLTAIFWVGTLSWLMSGLPLGLNEGLVIAIAFSETGRFVVCPRNRLAFLSGALIAIGSAMVTEATISYLGLGIQPPSASLGEIARSMSPLLALNDSSTLIPLLLVFLSAFGFRMLGAKLAA